MDVLDHPARQTAIFRRRKRTAEGRAEDSGNVVDLVADRAAQRQESLFAIAAKPRFVGLIFKPASRFLTLRDHHPELPPPEIAVIFGTRE
jgi:hypothetical protein